MDTQIYYIILANSAMVLSSSVSYWKWKSFKEFKNEHYWPRTIAFIGVIVCCIISSCYSLNSNSEGQKQISEGQKQISEGQKQISEGMKQIEFLKEQLIHIVRIPSRLKFAEIMVDHRNSQYKGISNSQELIASEIITRHKTFIKDSNEVKIEKITRICIKAGGLFPNKQLFEDKTGPKLGTSLELWVEQYEDTDENGNSVKDKIESKLGKFIRSRVSEWYDFYEKNEPKTLEEDKDIKETIKIIKQAIEDVYKISLPQKFDYEMINVFENQSKQFFDEMRLAQ